jgi:hypothetical protein
VKTIKNELDFVDVDIAQYFRDRVGNDEKRWRQGAPTEMQQARYTKRLCELMERLARGLKQ